MSGDHRVILADCLGPEGLASLPDKSVSHVITDPPYSEHVHANGRRGGALTTGHDGERPAVNVPQRRELDFEHLSLWVQVNSAAQFARVAQRWVLVFSDLESIFGWRVAFEAAGLEYVRCGIWVRDGCTPQFSGDRPAAACEAIIIGHQPGAKRWNGGGKRGVWSFEIVRDRGGSRFHTTEKPMPLMEALVSDFTDPGDLIADPFAGSGTTGVACKRLGRRFVGYERDAKYHAIAQKRIDGAREQLGIFDRPKAEKARQAALGLAGTGER